MKTAKSILIAVTMFMVTLPIGLMGQKVGEVIFVTKNDKRGVITIEKSEVKDNEFTLNLGLKWVDSNLNPTVNQGYIVVLDRQKIELSSRLISCKELQEKTHNPIILTSNGLKLNFTIDERYKGREVKIDLPFKSIGNSKLAANREEWEDFLFSRPRNLSFSLPISETQVVDKTPPEIRIINPEGVNLGMKPIVDSESIKVAVMVRDNFGIDNVMVNNRPTEMINDSIFIAEVQLRIGYENPINIIAVDKSGLSSRSQFAVESRPIGSMSSGAQIRSASTRREPSDVDVEIPSLGKVYNNRFTLIIGNEDYSTYQPHLRSESNVEFAIHDAEVFKQYAIKLLGVPEENIMLLTNARAVEMHNALDRMNLIAKNTEGRAEFFVFYAGHGFPDERTQEPYLIPVDVSGANLNFAIKLSEFYSKLTEHPTKRTTVFIDACFSGGGRDQGLVAARAVRIRPRGPQITGNIVVFSASSGDQSALPWQEKQHGMFTYHLLRKLKDSQGNVTYQELSDFLRTSVGTRSVIVNNKEQNPQTSISPSLDNNWMDWSFVD